MSAIAYRPEIDGLRAVAVLPVILFHLGWEWLPGGYLGVDVFFVISGYLITSIVHTEMLAGRFSLYGFYARRIRRILPALIAVTVVTLLVVNANVYKPEHSRIGRDAFAGLCSFANFRMWRSAGDYWGSLAAQSPFLHTWSLSVEEQFYGIFPLIVMLTARLTRGASAPAAVMLLVVAGSLTLFLYGVQHHPTATFYLLPTRAWELAIGGCCALFARAPANTLDRSAPRQGLGVLGLGLIVAGYVLLDELSAGTVVPVLGAALVLISGDTGYCRAWLSSRLPRWIGKISYSLYLWHWPVIVLSSTLGIADSPAAQLLVIVLLSVATYHTVEQPARKFARAIPAILAAYLGALGFALAMANSSGEYDVSAFATPESDQLRYDLQPTNQLNEYFGELYRHVTVPPRVEPNDSFLTGGILTEGTGDPRIVVFGDSHGVMFAGAIREAADRLGVKTAFWTMNGVSPFLNIPPRDDQVAYLLNAEQKLQYDVSRLNLIAKWRPRVAIICSAQWTGTPRPDDLLAYLQAHGVHTILMEPTPILESGGRSTLNQLSYLGLTPQAGLRRYLPAWNAVEGADASSLAVADLARRFQQTEVLRVRDLYLSGDQVLALDGKDVVFVDGSHLTIHGARIAEPRIRAKLMELFAPTP